MFTIIDILVLAIAIICLMVALFTAGFAFFGTNARLPRSTKPADDDERQAGAGADVNVRA